MCVGSLSGKLQMPPAQKAEDQARRYIYIYIYIYDLPKLLSEMDGQNTYYHETMMMMMMNYIITTTTTTTHDNTHLPIFNED
jgi:hypothetical protein